MDYIFLVYFFAQNFMIYANPLYQTCGPPCQCQHNPWYPSDLVFEPSNIDSHAIAPKHPTPTYQTPTENQEYVNKILSDPAVKTILDPNTKLYDINGIEIPRNNPGTCPNIINNYIIIPREVFEEKKHLKRSSGRKRNSQSRKIKSDHKLKTKNNRQIQTGIYHPNNRYGRINETYQKKVGINSIRSEDNKKHLNEQNKSSKTELVKVFDNGGAIPNDKDKVIRLKIITPPVNSREEAVVQEFRRKFPGIPEELVRSLIAHLKHKLTNGEINIHDHNSFISHNDKNLGHAVIKNNPNSRRRKERKNGRKRKNTKKKQKVTKDTKNESTSEPSPQTLDNNEDNVSINNVTRGIMKEQAEINSTKFDKDTQNVLTENAKIIETTTVDSVFDKTVNSDVIPQNFNENLKDIIEEKEKLTNMSAEVLENVGDTEIEEKTNQKEINENIGQNYKPDTDGHKLDYNYGVDNTRLPELGAEDEVPIAVNGLFDDYYPDFRSKNQISVSNEEFHSSSPQGERDDTTDRTIKMEELSRERRKYENNYDKNQYAKLVVSEEKVYEADKYNEKVSDKFDGSVPGTMTVYKESEEITFMGPPALETPDFETKNIKELKSYYKEASKHEPIHKYSDLLDKTSVYSDVKRIEYDKGKPVWKKEKHGDLETSFAPSKVAKYGHKFDDSDRYVIAESYPDYEW